MLSLVSAFSLAEAIDTFGETATCQYFLIEGSEHIVFGHIYGFTLYWLL